MYNEKENISIMLYGLSGVGKTNLIAAMLWDFFYRNKLTKDKDKSISYALEPASNVEEAVEANFVRDVIGKFKFENNNFILAGTSANSRFDFDFCATDFQNTHTYKWPIQISDYKGGILSIASNDEIDQNYSLIKEDIKKAHVLLFLIDAIELCRSCVKNNDDINLCAMDMNADSINPTLLRILGDMEDEKQAQKQVTVLFLLTKTDASVFKNEYKKYAEADFKELRKMTLDIYNTIYSKIKTMVKNNNWTFGFIPVCVAGKEHVETTIDYDRVINTIKENSGFQPQGIDVALLYALFWSFKGEIRQLEAELKYLDNDIENGKMFLVIDEGRIVGRCNSYFKARKLDVEKRALGWEGRMAAAERALQNKEHISKQIEELKELTRLIENGYEGIFKSKIFNRINADTMASQVRNKRDEVE